MTSKYSVSLLVKYKYSDIGEYIGEGYTNRAIRNDELVNILNKQDERIKELEAELENLNNECGKCKFFMIDNIKKYICTYHNCKLQSYNDKACNAFEKYKNGDD